MIVRAKKRLGQHFLKDKEVCEKIANQLTNYQNCKKVIEIGPGMGALSDFLIARGDLNLWLLEVDSESTDYLKKRYPQLTERIILGDFLRMDLKQLMGDEPFCVVGNFPYNISTEILFKCLENRNQIPEIMGMFQKEVAVRIAEKPGTKEYGIPSLKASWWAQVSGAGSVSRSIFWPVPGVDSKLVSFKRHETPGDEAMRKVVFQLVDAAFAQRRKMLRAALSGIFGSSAKAEAVLIAAGIDPTLRGESLLIDSFCAIYSASQSVK